MEYTYQEFETRLAMDSDAFAYWRTLPYLEQVELVHQYNEMARNMEEKYGRTVPPESTVAIWSLREGLK